MSQTNQNVFADIGCSEFFIKRRTIIIIFFIHIALTINRRNSYLFEIGSSSVSFLPVLAGFVYEIVQI